MSLILMLAALLPAAILMFYVYQKDKVEKEPPGLIARVFVLGALTGPIAAIVENVLFGVFEATVPPGLLLSILEFFIGVAAVEEAFKFLALSTVRKNPAFNYVFDGIVYAVAAALGFAALENVLYVFDGGLQVALVRAIFSVPGHCADGVVMGCFYGLARQREVAGNRSGARTYYLLAFLLPAIEHGFYDWGLSTESDLLVLLALAVEVVFTIIAFVIVNRVAKNDAPIGVDAASHTPTQPYQQPVQQPGQQPQPPSAYQQPDQPPVMSWWACPNCGQVCDGNFCGECGTRRP